MFGLEIADHAADLGAARFDSSPTGLPRRPRSSSAFRRAARRRVQRQQVRLVRYLRNRVDKARNADTDEARLFAALTLSRTRPPLSGATPQALRPVSRGGGNLLARSPVSTAPPVPVGHSPTPALLRLRTREFCATLPTRPITRAEACSAEGPRSCPARAKLADAEDAPRSPRPAIIPLNERERRRISTG